MIRNLTTTILAATNRYPSLAKKTVNPNLRRRRRPTGNRNLNHITNTTRRDINPNASATSRARNRTSHSRRARTNLMIASVNHHLRSVNLSVTPTRRIQPLTRTMRRRAERVLPTNVVPVVDVERQDHQSRIGFHRPRKRVRRRTRRAALTREQLNRYNPRRSR